MRFDRTSLPSVVNPPEAVSMRAHGTSPPGTHPTVDHLGRRHACVRACMTPMIRHIRMPDLGGQSRSEEGATSPMNRLHPERVGLQ